MTLPEAIRDATVQKVADRFDEVTGIGCFGLARRLLTACALTGMGSGLMLHGLDPAADAMRDVYDALLVSLPLLAASSYVRAAEGRMSMTTSPSVIPWLRNPWWVGMGLALLAMSAALEVPLVVMVVRLVQVYGTSGEAGWLVLGGTATAVMLLYPVGLLLACCEWRRRPRVRRRAPSRAAMVAG